MRMRWWLPAAVLTIALIVIAAGCSQKSTSARDMTPEEQFATFEQFTGGVDTIGAMSVPMIRSSAGMKFWDGVQPYDALSLLDLLNFVGFARPRLGGVIPSPLGKQVANPHFDLDRAIPMVLRSAAAQIGEYTYDGTSGWWKASLELTGAVDTSTTTEDGITSDISAAFSINMRDSVRFDNSLSGTPSEQPGSTTDRVRHGSRMSVDLSLSIVTDSQNVNLLNLNLKELELNGSGSNTVVDINGSTLTLTGNSTFGASIDLTATMPDTLPGNLLISTSAKGIVGLTAGANGVTMDMSSEPCPTAGALNAGLSLDIAASRNGENEKAKGTWDMTVDFTGGGNAHVTVESGAFSKEATGQVCQPPLQ